MIPHLRWSIRGRHIQPFSFAVSLSMFVLSWAFFFDLAFGSLLDQEPGDVLGVTAVVAAVLLSGGWWVRKPRVHSLGMLLASAVWMGVTAVLLVDVGWTVSTALASCWLVACSGSWLIETDANRGR